MFCSIASCIRLGHMGAFMRVQCMLLCIGGCFQTWSWMFTRRDTAAVGPLFAVHALSCTLSELLCSMYSQALGLVGESCETKLAQCAPMKNQSCLA